MAATSLLNFPEFIIAGLLALVTLFSLGERQSEAPWPQWLAQPAQALLLRLPLSYRQWILRNLVYAGWRSNFSLGDFACLKLYLPFLCLFTASFLPWTMVVLLAVCLWFALDLFLLILVKRRQRDIYHALPQALDLMMLCVDAGLGLDATMQRIMSENTGLSGALNEELNILGHEILLGVDRERAYRQLYIRTNVDELKTLGSALSQASKLGLSIARILRAQSDFIRKKQSLKAEEKAMRMPIFMAFPLWFFIMPSLMVLVLAPPLIKFYHQLYGSTF